MTESIRGRVRQIARTYLDQSSDPLGWFEALYAEVDGDASRIPWAEMVPNPNLVEWLDAHQIDGRGKRALKVGCGLGDDAEELARRGFDAMGFDISESAIRWCKERFPGTGVDYVVADLLTPPQAWERAFDFVFEAYTLQVLPPELRPKAIARIARFVAPNGILLVVCRGRDPEDDEGKMPWPLTREELARFQQCGLKVIAFEDYLDQETPPVRRFRVVYSFH